MIYNFRLLSFAIFASIILHALLIFNFELLKKSEEIFVVNLSEFQEFKFAVPVPEPKPMIEKKTEESVPKKILKPQIKKKNKARCNSN